MTLVLNAIDRSLISKSENNRLRILGKIPAVLYKAGDGKPGRNIILSSKEFLSILSSIDKGSLAVTKLSVRIGDEDFCVIVKGIQYDIVSYPSNIIHVDLFEITDDTVVTVKVPVKLLNITSNDCPGVKEGGVPRRNVKYIKIRSKFLDIPKFIFADMSKCHIGQSMYVSECIKNEDLKVVGVSLNDAIATIAKKNK